MHRRQSSSGVRPAITAAATRPCRTFVLANDLEVVTASVSALRGIVVPEVPIVVAGHLPRDLGTDLEVLAEPLDRGTGVRMLLALALRGAACGSDPVLVSMGRGPTGCSAEDVAEVREAVALSRTLAGRAPDRVLCVTCGARPVDEGCMLVASAPALLEVFRRTFPCVLRLFEYVASLHGSARSQQWDFVYRGLRTLDLWRDVLAPAESVSVIHG